MPIFVLQITIPASTAKRDAIRDAVTLDIGTIIDEVIIHVPAGNEATTPFWFEKDRMPVLPNDGRAFQLDDIPSLNLPAGIIMDRRGLFELVGYSTDGVDPHTIRAIIKTRTPSGGGA